MPSPAPQIRTRVRHQKRTGCSTCGERGIYDAREVLTRLHNTWQWFAVYLCGPCGQLFPVPLKGGVPIEQLDQVVHGSANHEEIQALGAWSDEIDYWLDRAIS
jgi:hypothetical protein